MRFFVWVICILLFVLFFVLALHNTAETSLVLSFGVVRHSPSVLIALVFFVVDTLLVMLAMAPRMMRRRFTAGCLCCQIGCTRKAEAVTEVSTPVVVDSPYYAPGPEV